MAIEYMRFEKVQPKNGVIGVCSFKFNKDFSFTQLFVLKLRNPKEHIRIRLLYPEKVAPSKDIQKQIDEEVNSFILARYPELFRSTL